MTLIRRLLFAIFLISCRRTDGRQASAEQYPLVNNLEQADSTPLIIEHPIQSIERHNDATLRFLQTQSWRTNNNNNNRNSGINPDGTTGENYWKDRINKGLRNVGLVAIIWFVIVGSIGMVCRCYLFWERLFMGGNSYNAFNNGDDGNHEDDRLDGVDMPPTSSSSFNGHQV